MSRRGLLVGLLAALAIGSAAADDDDGLSDEPRPLEEDLSRPWLLLELGEDFLGPGPVQKGFVLPTGAVWQPALWLFGTSRTAAQYFNDGETEVSEVTTRLDLFLNLKLSGTERLLFGVRPLDDDGQFTEYRVQHDPGFHEELNFEVETLFFEGELGEIFFPDVDPDDSVPLDLGFSVGRQALTFGDGMLVDDTIDAVGLTRNTVLVPGTSNLRLTALWGWGNVHRDDNRRDSSANLFGLFTSTDLSFSTIDADLAWVHDESDGTGDALFGGIGAVQRIGPVNTTFRVLGSWALERETAAAGTGGLLFSEVSWNPRGHDVLYWNAFWAIDEYSSAARGPSAGGPLGRLGILFAAQGLGRYGSPLSNRANEAFGTAVGYQLFLDGRRKQLIFEVGGRKETDGPNAGEIAFGVRYQQAIGSHVLFQADAFVRGQEASDDVGVGARIEFLVKF